MSLKNDLEQVYISGEKLTPILLEAKCKECGAILRLIQTLLSIPPLYKHECSVCGKEKILSRQYPCTVFKGSGLGIEIEESSVFLG